MSLGPAGAVLRPRFTQFPKYSTVSITKRVDSAGRSVQPTAYRLQADLALPRVLRVQERAAADLWILHHRPKHTLILLWGELDFFTPAATVLSATCSMEGGC